jgi:hypothetical protein
MDEDGNKVTYGTISSVFILSCVLEEFFLNERRLEFGL